MAYDPNNLSAGYYNNGFTRWHYVTPDNLDDVLELGYFEPGMLRVGDQIDIHASRNGSDPEFGTIAVAGTTAYAVTVVELASARLGQPAERIAAE